MSISYKEGSHKEQKNLFNYEDEDNEKEKEEE